MESTNNSHILLEVLKTKYNRVKKWILLLFLGICITGLFTWLNYGIAGSGGNWGKTDFMLIWLGGKGLTEGIDMYNSAAWEQLHVKYAGAYRDNPIFLYPLPAAFIFYPFSFLSVRVSATLWLLLSEGMLIFTIVYIFRKLKNPRPPTWSFILIFAVALFEPILIVIWSGQYSTVMLFFLVVFYVLAEKKQDGWAGVFLALLPLRPNPMVFIIPAVLIWAAWNKRWRIVFGSGLTFLGLLFVSELMRPGWASIWFSQTVGSGGKLYSYISMTATLSGMVYDFGGVLSNTYQWVIIIGISLLVCVVTIFWLLRYKGTSIGVVLATSTAISLFITPYAWNYDQIMLLFPILYILVIAENGNGRLRGLAWVGVVFLLACFPYVFRYVAIIRHRDSLSALLSLGALVGVLWAVSVFPGKKTSST